MLYTIQLHTHRVGQPITRELQNCCPLTHNDELCRGKMSVLKGVPFHTSNPPVWSVWQGWIVQDSNYALSNWDTKNDSRRSGDSWSSGDSEYICYYVYKIRMKMCLVTLLGASVQVNHQRWWSMEHMPMPLEDLCQYCASWSSFENLNKRTFVWGEGMRWFRSYCEVRILNVA